MTPHDPQALPAPFVEKVCHATDFSAGSASAFAHALAIALIRQTSLDILHAGRNPQQTWSQYPGVRQTLEKWGLLAPGSERSAVYDEFSVRVKKVHLKGNLSRSTLEYIDETNPDLLVLATDGGKGLERWLEPSINESIAHRSTTRTLFVPKQGRGFVAPETGTLSVRRILVPVDKSPDATNALVAATRAAEALGDHPVEISLLSVGEGVYPVYDRPRGEAWTWQELKRSGDVDEEIVAVAEEMQSDLIIMATDGRNGVLDAFRGSFTERVLRRAKCPVLAVPAPT